MALARLRWNPGGPAVEFVAQRFSVPYAYLPQDGDEFATIESLEVFSPLPPLHAYQEEVKSAVEAVLRTPAGRALVQMPTGSGKTRTVVEALVAVWGEALGPGAVVWLAHAEELCDQAADSISRVWSQNARTDGRLIRYYGSHEPPAYAIPGSVVVASLQKAFARLRSGAPFIQSLRTATRLVVVDEAHRALAPSFREIAEALADGGGVLIGLSATPGRGIGRDRENTGLAEMFGQHLISPTSEEDVISKLQSEGILARVTRQLVETGVRVEPSGEEAEGIRQGFDYGTGVLRTLASNTKRNRILIDLVEEHLSLGRPTIVFACTVAHARMLSAALSLRGVAAAHIDGEMNRADRKHTVAQFRDGEIDVLVNFGILTTGFDAPRTRTVMVARPTMSAVLYGQMIGRALRGPKMGGGEDAWVVDVHDNFTRFGSVDSIYQAFERFWDAGTPDSTVD